MKKFLFTALLATCSNSAAIAQDTYPSKPVTALVGYAPGGNADLVMRKLAQIMAPKFPAGLVVENKPGAGGALSVSILASSKADGYQFAFLPNSNLALSPQVNKLSYTSPDDVLPVITTVSFSPVMLVPNNSPYQTVKDFLQAAKKEPGTLSAGFPGVTTLSHLNLLEFSRVADIKLIEVPTKGWGAGAPLLLGGQLKAAIAQPSEAIPNLKSSRMRALGSFSDNRQVGLSEVPTMKEQGIPVGFGVRYLIAVPKGTPANAVQYIHDAAKAAIETPEFKKFCDDNGLNIVYQDGTATLKAANADYHQYTSILEQNGLLKK